MRVCFKLASKNARPLATSPAKQHATQRFRVVDLSFQAALWASRGRDGAKLEGGGSRFEQPLPRTVGAVVVAKLSCVEKREEATQQNTLFDSTAVTNIRIYWALIAAGRPRSNFDRFDRVCGPFGLFAMLLVRIRVQPRCLFLAADDLLRSIAPEMHVSVESID